MKFLELSKYPLLWEMTNSEKIGLLQLLDEIKPEISIEIGTKEGGSLQLISEYSKKVYSLDIDPGVKALESRFPNVEFIIGDSKVTLRALLEKLAAEGASPDFILVDGDHTPDGVCNDINTILAAKITRPLTIIMHDSFNFHCRKGMLEANYASSKHVHYVELDYVNGVYSVNQKTKGGMWGGFGMILMKPEVNGQPVEIKQSGKYPFEQALKFSRDYAYVTSTLPERIRAFIVRKFFI